jgi:3-oxoacyl-[acyl-carrier protein] reductase
MINIHFNFKGHKALVIGGSRGIGKSVALKLLEAGSEVIITGKTKILEGWWSEYSNCKYLSVDFINEIELTTFLNKIANYQIDLLIYSAGIINNSLLSDINNEEIDNIFKINFFSILKTINQCTKNMKLKKYGKIVNISSIAAILTRPGLSIYSSSKAAILSLTRTAALEFASYNILINSVCPGYTETDMLSLLDNSQKEKLLNNVPLGRFCKPEEIADLVLFLLSNNNKHITGQTFIIDGGVTIKQ